MIAKTGFSLPGGPWRFSSPGKMIEYARALTMDLGWDFGEQDFERLESQEIEWPRSVNCAAVIVPRFHTVRRNMEELWSAAVVTQGGKAAQWDEFRFDSDHLRLSNKIQHKAGLSWEFLNLDTYRGIASVNLDAALGFSPFAVFACAVFHPYWVRAMDGVLTPYVLLHGLEATVPDIPEWEAVPNFFWCQEMDRLVFGATSAYECNKRWAAPQLLP